MADLEAACAACSGSLAGCPSRHGRGNILDAFSEEGQFKLYLRRCDIGQRALQEEQRVDKARRRDELFKCSGIPAGCEHMTFDTFNPTPGTKRALEAACAIAEGAARKGLCLYGPTKRGKTHLLMAIVRHRAESGGGAEYHVLPDLLKAWRHTYDQQREPEFMAYLRSVPVLALDDIAAPNVTDWGLEQLYLLANWRELDGTTLLTACDVQGETAPDDLIAQMSMVQGRFSPARKAAATRIVSRLRCLGRWIETTGPHYMLGGPDMFQRGEETS